MEQVEKIVLNLGCGPTRLNSQTLFFEQNGYREVRVDVQDSSAHVKCDLLDLKEIEDESADAIWISHVVEHFHFHQLPDLFNSMMRVLKSDGFIVVSVPDLASIADLIATNPLETVYIAPNGFNVTALDMIYGHRGYIASDNKELSYAMMHKTGFTAQSMSQILESLGIKAMIKTENKEVMAILFKDKIPSEEILRSF